MDAMALLCNLQADGPQTLRKLHELGCHTLGDLERVPVFELADALDSDAGFAQRFIREARSLRQRFGSGELEPEPLAEEAPASGSTRPTSIVERENASRPEPDTLRPAAPPAASRPLRSLSTQPPGTPLRAGLIEGLGADWCQALVGQGVLSLETLIDAPGLALARSLGRSYTELLDLQCLAKRYVAQRGAAVTLERDDAREPEIVRPATPAPRPPIRPLAEPDYTIFPPRTTASGRIPPTERAPRADPRTSHTTTSDPKREEQDAGIGGPFA